MSAPKDPEKRKIWIENISKTLTGRKLKPFTQEHKDNISKAMIGKNVGENNPMFGRVGCWHGKKRPDQSERMKGEGNPMFGKKRPDNIERNRQRMGEKHPYFSEILRQQIGPKNPNWKEKIHKICLICKYPFDVIPSKKKQQSCSIECKAKLQSERTKGKNSYLFGIATEKHPCYGRIGVKHPMYIDGRSYEPYTPEFNNKLKKSIRSRDGYKCQKCGLSEIENKQKLAIHHIDYDKFNCKRNNLISLCGKCNSEVNTNRKKWTKYFQKKLTGKYQQSQLCFARL